MLKNLIQYILIAYIGFAIFAYFFSNKIIFPAPASGYKDFQGIIKLKTSDNKIISAVYLPNKEAKYTVLLSHGNYEDLGTVMPFLQHFQKQGFAVFAYDYHGYGTSSGTATEQNVYYDINAAYDYLVKNLKIKPENIIAFGFSIGSAVAIDLAAREKVAALIVQSPFLSAYRTVTQIPLLPLDKFNNLTKIKKINVPLLIIHGINDHIVPFWQGRKLYNEANQPKYFYQVDGARHNDLVYIANEKYWQTIKDFVAKLP